ncbi:MAG: 1-(5-phosphoribosyl)-5-[(5-phosphoribosylamino)methylideneamino]imidazole-4-carboxamide isomerase [Candidatus Hydrogenedentes bacterium]|nr:1-(5-phosphoribosyl)-5-[(5-phosphoribosylamino)methylideneamino]imidazole-4-carboxamide isomerase [Candidatus Hydrogenedentota bacterium]
MRVVPAVDIKGGQCVRLRQGEMNRVTVFEADPVAAAVKWRDFAAPIVHVVDLDGAVGGGPRTLDILKRMVEAGVAVEFGGGIRNQDDADAVARTGVERIVVGTVAAEDKELFAKLTSRYGPKLAVALDVKDGKVAVAGWVRTTGDDAVEFAAAVESAGVSRLIVTSIARDGMMTGPDLGMTRRIAETVNIPVTVSGGISTLDDVRRAARLADCGVDEMIVGRALYEGRFTYSEACQAAREKW